MYVCVCVCVCVCVHTYGCFKMLPKSLIYEKYKTARSIKFHFLQNGSLVQLYISASHYKGVGSIPGSHFVKAFSAPLPHS